MTPLEQTAQTAHEEAMSHRRAEFMLLWKSKLAPVLLTLTANPGDVWRYQHIAWLAFKAGKGET